MEGIYRTVTIDDGVRIAYHDEHSASQQRGVIVLLHGFPQTSYQFRHVVKPLASAGYRVISPDYRGAGLSSKPDSGFTKSVMAADISRLLNHLGINEPIHLVGHDIGGMIAYVFASRYPDRIASLIWGECPLPGTTVHDAERAIHGVQQFHFLFHSVPDLPEALVTGREEIYLTHFMDKVSYNRTAISQADIDHYVKAYSQPGALRCAFGIYRAFLEDAKEMKEWTSTHGKCKVRTLGLDGAQSRHKDTAERMLQEAHELGTFSVAQVPESGHYIAEENPDGFTKIVLDFISGKN